MSFQGFRESDRRPTVRASPALRPGLENDSASWGLLRLQGIGHEEDDRLSRLLPFRPIELEQKTDRFYERDLVVRRGRSPPVDSGAVLPLTDDRPDSGLPPW